MRFKIAVIFFILSITVFGQQSSNKVNIIGSVYDAESNFPLQYATVTLQNLDNNKFNGCITNKKGRFDIEIPTGKYKFTVEFLSFKPFVIKVLNIEQDFDMGMIALTQKTEELNEVELSAGNNIMEYKFDKKIYYASKDIGNRGGNAITVLENTPTLRLDDKGNINIRGNKAMIFVDGKPFGGQGTMSDVLSLIPSNAISKIEIISPSAKYDANGGGGIVNIILKKGKSQGYSGTVEVHGGIPDNDGISSFLTYKSEKVNVYSTVSFNHQVKIKNSNIEQDYFKAGNPSGNLDEIREDDRQKNSFLFNIGSDFNIDDKNTITTTILYSISNKNYFSELTLDNYNAAEHLTSTTFREVRDNTDDNNFEALLNYTTVFDSEEHKLSFDIKYNLANSDNDTDILNQITYPDNELFEQQSFKVQSVNNYLFQMDYQRPFTKNGLLEAGIKSNSRRYSNDFRFSSLDPVTLTFQPVSGFENNINYSDDVFAAYANYSKQYEQFNFSVALRAEMTKSRIKELSADTDVKNQYTDLFPSVQMGYTFKNDGQLSFNYIRYIDRPDIIMLNPFTSITDNRFILTGNPYLLPSYTNSLLMEYYKQINKLTFTAALFYTGTKDQIRYIIENTGDETADGYDVYLRRPVNDGKIDQYGFDMSLTYIPDKHFRVRLYIQPYYFNIYNTFENAYDYNDYVFYSNITGDYRFTGGLKFQLSYSYQSPKKTALTTLKTIQFLNASVSQDLFNKKATITFRANDILRTRTYEYESLEADTFTNKSWRFDSQFLLSFTYRFNKASRRNSHNRSKDIDKEIFDIDEDIK